jgi:hypothetical protein
VLLVAGEVAVATLPEPLRVDEPRLVPVLPVVPSHRLVVSLVPNEQRKNSTEPDGVNDDWLPVTVMVSCSAVP